LKSIVREEIFLYPHELGKYASYRNFKTFTNPVLKGFSDDLTRQCGQWLRLCIEEFAESWLEAIKYAIQEATFIETLLKHTDAEYSESNEIESNLQIELNLTVSEIAYFINLMVRAHLIEIPSRKTTEFINLLARNVRTKKCDSIHPKSLRNKYTTPDLNTIDTCKKTLAGWLLIIQEDQETLSR
jgi:hypothetical protein